MGDVMSSNSKIEWTDASWNPVVGCSVVSPGCTNCYAMKMAARLEKMLPKEKRGFDVLPNHYAALTQPSKAGPVWTGRVNIAPDHILTAPLRWKKPKRIFVNSMGDLFHENVPNEWIDKVFAVMALCPQHSFMVLSKRADRMRGYFKAPMYERVGALMGEIGGPEREGWYAPACDGKRGWLEVCAPLPNVMLGVSVEDQKRADERIPHLLATPAAVRFISAEPLLGELDLRRVRDGAGIFDALSSKLGIGYGIDNAYARRIDWVIAGGETGRDARPMHPRWVRSLRDQCAAANVPFFFKQWGNWKPICNMPEDEFRPLYKSNRIACDGESQENLDDIHGRTCTVDTLCLRDDGAHCPSNSPNAFLVGTNPVLAFHVGKKRSGRLLDGVEHNCMPGMK